MVFCSQYHALHAYYTHRELSNRLEPAAMEGQEDMAMITFQPEARDLNTSIQELRRDHQALTDQVIALQHDNTSLQAKVKFLEGTAKKQAARTKSLESRLNTTEPGPPDYGVSSVTRHSKKAL